MPCYFPLQGYFIYDSLGNRKFKFSKFLGESFDKGIDLKNVDVTDSRCAVPCGKCEGCRLERSRQWGLRCIHEASLHDQNCFITLTYNDEFLPRDMSVKRRHFQLFIKRLRKKFGSGIRYYGCGEYGERMGRPHYHACLFGIDFGDKKLFEVTSNGDRLYVSDDLNSLWIDGKSRKSLGFCTVGALTFKSAAYVARYVMKKVNGQPALEHYQFVESKTGEVFLRSPEFGAMSLKPGIGRGYFDKWTSDVYPSDYVILNGKKCKPPRYYDVKYGEVNPDGLALIKDRRKERGDRLASDNTARRLADKFIVQLSRLKRLVRS